MLIKSNKGSNCIPPLRNTINWYLSWRKKIYQSPPPPPFESKTNDSITDIFVTVSEIVDII